MIAFSRFLTFFIIAFGMIGFVASLNANDKSTNTHSMRGFMEIHPALKAIDREPVLIVGELPSELIELVQSNTQALVSLPALSAAFQIDSNLDTPLPENTTPSSPAPVETPEQRAYQAALKAYEAKRALADKEKQAISNLLSNPPNGETDHERRIRGIFAAARIDSLADTLDIAAGHIRRSKELPSITQKGLSQAESFVRAVETQFKRYQDLAKEAEQLKPAPIKVATGDSNDTNTPARDPQIVFLEQLKSSNEEILRLLSETEHQSVTPDRLNRIRFDFSATPFIPSKHAIIKLNSPHLNGEPLYLIPKIGDVELLVFKFSQ